MLIEPELTGALVSEYRRLSGSTSAGSSLTALTEKEIEIIRYVATGRSNREIADKLAYSEKTVKNYLSIIFQKLGIRDRTQAHEPDEDRDHEDVDHRPSTDRLDDAVEHGAVS